MDASINAFIWRRESNLGAARKRTRKNVNTKIQVACVYIYTCACLYPWICVFIFVCGNACMRVSMHVFLQVFVYLFAPACNVYIYKHVLIKLTHSRLGFMHMFTHHILSSLQKALLNAIPTSAIQFRYCRRRAWSPRSQLERCWCTVSFTISFTFHASPEIQATLSHCSST